MVFPATANQADDSRRRYGLQVAVPRSYRVGICRGDSARSLLSSSKAGTACRRRDTGNCALEEFRQSVRALFVHFPLRERCKFVYYSCMPSINITISTEAHARLSSLKK